MQKIVDAYKSHNIGEYLSGNSYPGRGIVIGFTPDGEKAVSAYFIMGRSENSRNRVFVEENDNLLIRPFDPAALEDPSLIIYYPIRVYNKNIIVTNGDQTDTIYSSLKEGGTFAEALRTRRFEPDSPNWTPRISGIVDIAGGSGYRMSILKSADRSGNACNRYFYEYEPVLGEGRFLHTYITDADPLPTFTGEPFRVSIPFDIDSLTGDIWNNLDKNNRISLYVRYTDVKTG